MYLWKGSFAVKAGQQQEQLKQQQKITVQVLAAHFY